MGKGASSKSTSEVVNEIIANVTVENIKSAANNIQQTQELKIKKVRGDVNISDIDFSQYATIDTQAIQNSENMTDLKNEMYMELMNQAEAKSSGLLSAVGGSKSKTETYVKNAIDNNIKQSTVQDCVSSIMQKQSLELEDIEGNVTIQAVKLDQMASSSLQCLQSSKDVVALSNELGAVVDSSASAITEDPITKVAGGIGSVLGGVGDMFGNPIFWIVALILLGVAAYMFFKYQSGKSEAMVRAAQAGRGLKQIGRGLRRLF